MARPSQRVKPLSMYEWDAGSWAIGYAGEDPIFYFDERFLELAGKITAAYNEHAASHQCRTLLLDEPTLDYVCVECQKHHVVQR